MNLLFTEMRRAIRRRAVRVLIAIALAGCALAGVIGYFGSVGKTLTELRFDDEGSPALMTDWWVADSNEGFLAVAMFFLFLGAFFGGATVVGGEWRAGTVTTVLTWEPRRLRLHAARTSSAAILSFVISFGLQVMFLASFLPAVFLNGTTEGADVSFWTALMVVMVRTSLLSAGAAVLTIALATLGRNTAFALIAMFTWLIVIEGLIRGLRPSLSQWLWAENIATVMTWERLDQPDISRGPVIASATLIVYCATFVGLAATSFQWRDIAAAT
jgi:hypothetical protein